MATFNGQVQAGDMAAVVLIMSNLYRPLSILGFAFREIKQGRDRSREAVRLMGMKAEVSGCAGCEDAAGEGRRGAVRECELSRTMRARPESMA